MTVIPSLFAALVLSHRLLSPGRHDDRTPVPVTPPVTVRGGAAAGEGGGPTTATALGWGIGTDAEAFGADVSRRPLRGDGRATLSGVIMGMTGGGAGGGDGEGGGDEGSTSEMEMEVEVEQKFALIGTERDASSVEEGLRSLGFRLDTERRFVDTYVDAPGPAWSLTRRDHWLRYREYLEEDGEEDCSGDGGGGAIDAEKKKGGRDVGGIWQLKRRPGCATAASSAPPTPASAATAYEELDGDGAVGAALTLLGAETDSPDAGGGPGGDVRDGAQGGTPEGSRGSTAELPPPPGLPGGCGLVPFARFETRRSAWVASAEAVPDDGERGDSSSGGRDEYRGLRVDLDATDFGHAVGEVETVVSDPSQIPEARDRIGRLVGEIVGFRGREGGGGGDDATPNTAPRYDDKPTLGKLEVYMMRHRRDQYEACVQAGSL